MVTAALGRWCLLCNSIGTACLGGDNRDCVRRLARPSRIGGIIDSYGGVRVVVTHPKDFKNHLRCGEFLAVVPRIIVHEPVAWDRIPYVVGLGEQAVAQWVKDNEFSNDPEKREAIFHYKSRRLWHPSKVTNLDLLRIAYT